MHRNNFPCEPYKIFFQTLCYSIMIFSYFGKKKRYAAPNKATDLRRTLAPSSSGSSSLRIWSFELFVSTYLPVNTVYHPRRREYFEVLTIINIVVNLVSHILHNHAEGCSFSELPVNLGVKWSDVTVKQPCVQKINVSNLHLIMK
jgi:hypothetical protein